MKAILLFCFILPQIAYSQQKHISVKFVPYFLGAALKADSIYILENDTVSVSACRFYISNPVIATSKGNFAAESNALLVDLSSGKNTLLFSVPQASKPLFLTFDLGIDSTTNVSGAMPGDLDPMHGMYWTWQSGYINFKLEGTSSESSGRNKAFQYHLGGYASPFAAIQHIHLELRDSEEIIIRVDISAFLKAADLQKTSHIMRPCSEAVSLSKILAAQFVLN